MKLSRILIYTLVVFGPVVAYGQDTPYFTEKGVAVGGYDVVAYFTQQAAVKGSSNFSFSWDEVTWHFSSSENLNLFKEHPQRYAPQFGGWCAYGVSENHKSPTQPEAFTIVNEKLYLNYNQKVLKLWRSDTTRYIRQANAYWPALK
ncbi:MAG: YHS domain protein [Cytophagales bacterium]|nr:YHS domain protein [Cytophagales bacterium]